MSNNAAIILAVSNYKNPDDCLPGCIQDAQIMKTLLDATGKYSELLLIDKDPEGIKVKEKLSEFISTRQDKIFKDIVDYISDEFEKNLQQRPFFVNQADFTEIFCNANHDFKNLVQKEMNRIIISEPEYRKNQELSLVDLVTKDAERYCNQEEVIEKINLLQKTVEDYSYSPEILSLYKIQNSFEQDYKSISSHSSIIGKWLAKNEHNYFAKTVDEEELIQNNAVDDIFSNLARVANPMLTSEKKYRKIIKGYQLTSESPFYIIKIDAKPNYPNINWCDCKIAFVFSQVTIRFFYYFANFKLKNWTQYSHEFTANWQTLEVELNNQDKFQQAIYNILSKFDSFILDPLKAKYILTVESNEVEEENYPEE